VGGAGPGEGAIITRDRLNTADVWRLGADNPGGAGANSWFRLQTNYDHWEKPPASDDRRTPSSRFPNPGHCSWGPRNICRCKSL
jgi:hypothetical protein